MAVVARGVPTQSQEPRTSSGFHTGAGVQRYGPSSSLSQTSYQGAVWEADHRDSLAPIHMECWCHRWWLNSLPQCQAHCFSFWVLPIQATHDPKWHILSCQFVRALIVVLWLLVLHTLKIPFFRIIHIHVPPPRMYIRRKLHWEWGARIQTSYYNTECGHRAATPPLCYTPSPIYYF